MLNLDRALAMLVEEAAGLDRRTVAQFLTLLVEESVLTMDDAKFQVLWQRLEEKVEAIEDPKDKAIVKVQTISLLDRLADLQQKL